MTGRTVSAVVGMRRKLRVDPRKINLAGIAVPRCSKPEAAVESWGITVEDAQALLDRQMCPVCGSGPWQSPLNHVSRKHGIDRLTMRDICGLSMKTKVTDPTVRAAWEQNGKSKVDILRENNRDRAHHRKPRKTLRARETSGKGLRDWEAANPEAVAQMRAGFRERMTSPEVLEKHRESMKRARAKRVYTPEQRAAFRETMGAPEVQAKIAEWQESRRQEGCTVEGCAGSHVARGYCKKHWRRWQLYGDPCGRGKIGQPRALSDEQEHQALAMLAEGESQHAVARYFGCSQTAISRLVKRRDRGE